MELIDKDLASIQAVRTLIEKAHKAQKRLQSFSQQELDVICSAISRAGLEQAEALGKMAQEETGFGIAADKKIKNELAAGVVYDSIKDMKTVGILREDKEQRITEVGVPMGVIAALIPSTNPTSTVLYKALVCLKAGNAVVFSPHPSAFRCIKKTVDIVKAAAISAGCPADAISCMELLTMESTKELMQHSKIALILATGGTAMVKAAYSSGNPAIGVGPGNGAAFIEKSADIPLAVKRILDSKTFDNGTICASEQSIIVEKESHEAVVQEFKRQGAYFLNPEEKEKVGKVVINPNGFMNAKIVGKPATYIAKVAGICVPENTRVLIGFEDKVGPKVPFSKEKLCPVLAFYTEDNWEAACARSMEILLFEGAGHTMAIHSNNEAIIREFALHKPVNRLLVNTPAALGGVGATTNLPPALTLGCGAIGGSSSSDNITPMNLINIRRVAYGVRELSDIKQTSAPSMTEQEAFIEKVVEKILRELKK